MKRYFISILAAVTLLPLSVYAESVWDGSVDTEWERDGNGNYLIQSAAELAGLAYVLNSQELVYQANTEWHAYYGSGKTFLLTDDINLNNIAWEPIGYLAKDNKTNTNRVRRYFKELSTDKDTRLQDVKYRWMGQVADMELQRKRQPDFGVLSTMLLSRT